MAKKSIQYLPGLGWFSELPSPSWISTDVKAELTDSAHVWHGIHQPLQQSVGSSEHANRRRGYEAEEGPLPYAHPSPLVALYRQRR